MIFLDQLFKRTGEAKKKRKKGSLIKFRPWIISGSLPAEKILFSWEDEKKIREFLISKFNLPIKEEEFQKNANGKRITAADGTSASIQLIQEKVVVEIGEKRYVYQARTTEANKTEVYEAPRVIDHYFINLAEVTLYDFGGRGYYWINEPRMSEDDLGIYSTIQEAMRISTPAEEIESDITQLVMNTVKRFGLEQQALPILDKLLYYVKRDQEGYEILDALIQDEGVEEIMFEGYSKGPVTVIHRRHSNYAMFDTNISFTDDDVPREVVSNLASRVAKPISLASPLLEGMTKEVYRVAATFRTEASLPGTSFTIRKHLAEPLTMAQLLKAKMISPLIGAYMWLMVECKGFTEIIGATGSGKTTLLSAAVGLFLPSEKIVTIEDSPEIKLPQKHWLQLTTRIGFGPDAAKNTVTMMDLTKYALRVRPDLLVPGESRGTEIHDLMQAAASGHACITTFHAESPAAAIARMRAPPLSVGDANLQLIWSFVMATRLLLGSERVRRVTLISEPDPFKMSEMKEVFKWDANTDSFYPDDAEKVYEASHRLSYSIPLQTGWTKEKVISELKERSEFLERCRDLKYGEFYASVEQFYIGKYSTI